MTIVSLVCMGVHGRFSAVLVCGKNSSNWQKSLSEWQMEKPYLWKPCYEMLVYQCVCVCVEEKVKEIMKKEYHVLAAGKDIEQSLFGTESLTVCLSTDSIWQTLSSYYTIDCLKQKCEVINSNYSVIFVPFSKRNLLQPLQTWALPSL